MFSDMFNFITNLISSIRVEEKNNLIYISGTDMTPLLEDIRKYWGTSKIGEYLFTYQKKREVAFSRFFAVEVLYMINTLLQRRYTRTPKRALAKIKEELETNTWLVNTFNNEGSILDQTQLNKFFFTPTDEQKGFFDHVGPAIKRMGLRGYLLDSAPGTGKALELDAKLRTVDGGYILNKDIKVGDKILAWDGTQTTVEGVFDQGVKNVYEIVFEDGRVGRCCEDHLWAVYHNQKRWLGKNILPLKTMLKFGAGCLSIDLPKNNNAQALISKALGYMNSKKVKLAGDPFTNATFHCLSEPCILYIQSLYRQAGYLAEFHKKVDRSYIRISKPNVDGRISLRSIRYVGQRPVQCIKVDHPDSLFVYDDYIVTHNTYMSLAFSEMTHADTIIVVCPKPAIDDPWKVSLEALPKKPYTFWTSDDAIKPTIGKGVFVLHYEYINKFLEDLYKVDPANLGKTIIILDESHNMNESTKASDRSFYFVKMCQYLKDAIVLWMSGTPVKAMGKEVIPMLKTIDPLFDKHTEERFRQIFGKSSSRANDIIAHRLGLVKYTIKKESVVKGKPIFHEVSVKLPNGKDFTLESIRKVMLDFVTERTKYYKANMDNYVKEYLRILDYVKMIKPALAKEVDDYLKVATLLRKYYDPKIHKKEPIWCNTFEKEKILPLLEGSDKAVFKDARSVYKYVELKIQGEALGKVFGRLRIECFKQMANLTLPMRLKETGEEITMIDMINASLSKTVFFTSSVEVAKSLLEQTKAIGMKAHIVFADTNKQLSSILKDMREDEDCALLIATYDSLSTAVPLTMCSTIINGNAPFRDHEREQSISRCFRLGQPHQVTVYDLFLDTGGVDNISTRSKDIMEWSRKQVEEILGRKETTASIEDIKEDITGEFFPEKLADSLEDLANLLGHSDAESLVGGKWIQTEPIENYDIGKQLKGLEFSEDPFVLNIKNW